MDIARALSGGDRRSIGRAQQLVEHILSHPEALDDLVEAFEHDEARVRMRAADVAEKVSRRRADWLQGYLGRLLSFAETSGQQEVRWHLAQMLPRLTLSPPRRRRAAAAFFKYLDDKSRIVRVSAMTALVELSEKDPALRRRVTPVVTQAARSEAPSMRARAKMLLARLNRGPGCAQAASLSSRRIGKRRP